MKEAVQQAINAIKAEYSESEVIVQDDGQDGAFVTVENVDVGESYTPSSTWIGFRITFQYPHADVYPHFIRSDLVRKDGRPLGDGISSGQNFVGRPAHQISRRSNRLNPATDTALLKLQKVLKWLKEHP